MSYALVVDDSPLVLAQVGGALRDAGHEADTSDNAPDALCRVLTRPPDVLLLDLNLNWPGMNGEDLLRKLGRTAPPVIVMTGAGRQLEDFAGTPVRRVVRKPFELGDIMGAVNDVLGGKPVGGAAADPGTGGGVS